MNVQNFSKIYTKIYGAKKFYLRIGDDDPQTIVVTIEKDEKGRPKYILPEGGGQLFTQEHMNATMAEAKRKSTQSQTELISQLEALKAESSTSATMKEELETKIALLKEQSVSEVDELKGLLKKEQDGRVTEAKKLAAERDAIQKRYQETLIRTDIANACAAHKTASTEIMEPLISRNCAVEDVLDETTGKSTGEHRVVVSYKDKNSEGIEVVKKAPVGDYVKWMKEQEGRFDGLFQHSESGGAGYRPAKGGDKDAGALTAEKLKDMTFEDYLAVAEKK